MEYRPRTADAYTLGTAAGEGETVMAYSAGGADLHDTVEDPAARVTAMARAKAMAVPAARRLSTGVQGVRGRAARAAGTGQRRLAASTVTVRESLRDMAAGTRGGAVAGIAAAAATLVAVLLLRRRRR